MSIIIGGIDLFRQSIDSEYRTTILEMILEKILQKNPSLINPEEIEKIKEAALTLLQSKYPEARIIKLGDDNEK